MQTTCCSRSIPFRFVLRMPGDPVPPPIQEPQDPTENPDVFPVREPDPEQPEDI